MSYKIVRYYERGEQEVVVRGLTLEQAQAHCQDPQTSSKTATGEAARQRTETRGSWFDGYREER